MCEELYFATLNNVQEKFVKYFIIRQEKATCVERV